MKILCIQNVYEQCVCCLLNELHLRIQHIRFSPWSRGGIFSQSTGRGSGTQEPKDKRSKNEVAAAVDKQITITMLKPNVVHFLNRQPFGQSFQPRTQCIAFFRKRKKLFPLVFFFSRKCKMRGKHVMCIQLIFESTLSFACRDIYKWWI